MGVFLCIGQSIHNLTPSTVPFSDYGSFEAIQADVSLEKPVFVLLGTGTHRVKKKAEQMACEGFEELED